MPLSVRGDEHERGSRADAVGARLAVCFLSLGRHGSAGRVCEQLVDVQARDLRGECPREVIG
jgi:hypothetical protein